MSDSRAGIVFYRVAMLCGILPMTVGVAVYLLYEITRWDSLPLIGMFTIRGGLVSVAIGFVCVIAYAFKRHAVGQLWGPRVGKAVSVMVLNIPVCLIVIILGINSMTRFTVVLENEGQETITRFEIEGPGVEKTIEDVAPGKSKSARMHFNNEGTLVYRAEVRGELMEGTIEGYVTGADGGKSIVTFSDTAFSAQRTEW
ncbi:MAG: hypothetical protein AAGI91_04020 [Bacteroidota bacterium]